MLSPRLLVAVSVLACSAVLAGQTTTVVQASRDNTIYAEDGTVSNGAGPLFLCGKSGAGNTRRGLLAFDVGAVIPAGALVQSARVELTLDRSPIGSPVQVALHRLTADWGEAGSNAGAGGPPTGPGNGAPAQTGDATWTQRFFPATAWSQAGGDFIANASASAPISGTTTRASWTSSQLAVDVQAWLNGSQPNHGWAVLGDETASFTGIGFRSREYATAADRPALVVTWVPAATVSPLGNGCTGSQGGQLLLSAIGQPTVPNATFAVSLGGGPTGPRAYFAFLTASPVPLPLNATCFVYGDPATLLATVLLQGPLPLPIPPDTSLYGAELVLQGLAVDQFVSQLVTSNALVLTLGL